MERFNQSRIQNVKELLPIIENCCRSSADWPNALKYHEIPKAVIAPRNKKQGGAKK
jgi:hypothetical protein